MTGRAWRRSGCLRVFHPRADCAARLVCFAHAGGTASAFLPLSEQMPGTVEVVAVQYPGRQDRRSDPLPAKLTGLAAEAVSDLAAFSDRPLTFYGHSMGALVAFEAALELADRGWVTQLLASGAWPPSRDWHEPDLDTWTDGAIVAELRRLGGVPEPVLAEPEILAEVIRIVRADQRLIRGYRRQASHVLAIPVSALLGDADPKNNVEQMAGWARHTSAAFSVQVLPGGHFYLHDPAAQTARLIAGLVQASLDASLAGRGPNISWGRR